MKFFLQTAKIKLIIILLCYNSGFVFSQFSAGAKIYLAPRLTLGYTLKAGFNYGLDLNIGLYGINYNKFVLNSGVSLSAYYVNYSVVNHLLTTANILLESDYFTAKAGYGMITYKWGYRNRNMQRSDGLNFDLALSVPQKPAPAVGVKFFMPNPDQLMEFTGKNYLSGYLFFRQEPILLSD